MTLSAGKLVLLACVLLVFAGAAYKAYVTYVMNPNVAEELRRDPDGARAQKVMLLTLPDGHTIPVNYLREGDVLFTGADGRWWKAFEGDGAAAEVFLQGNTHFGHGRAVLDDRAYRDEVFSRLRPTFPSWIPEWAQAKLVVVTLEAD